MAALLQFDGGARPNPGPGGAGAVLLGLYDGDVIWEGSKSFTCTTNNEAEYSGLIMGLEKALELRLWDLEVEGDSKLVVEQVNGNWRINKEHLRALQRRVLALRDQFDSFSLRHIPRSRNTIADGLATSAILNAQDSDDYYSRTEQERPTGKRRESDHTQQWWARGPKRSRR